MNWVPAFINLVGAGYFVFATGCLFTQSAWLPDARYLEITPRYVYQTFDAYWAGRDARFSLPGSVDQHSALIATEYGICDYAAADVTFGYTWISTQDFDGRPGTRDDGMADTRIGLRLRLLDEDRASTHLVPTLTLRVGAIVAGTYAPFESFAAGEGAHGGEFSLMFGKTLPLIGTGLFGEAGYRVRGSASDRGMSANVPNDIFGNVGVFQPIGPCVLTFGYRHIQALTGDNIGDPGYTFPALKQVNQMLEAGVGYRDSRDRYYQIFGAWNIGGRNTGDNRLVAASVSIPF